MVCQRDPVFGFGRLQVALGDPHGHDDAVFGQQQYDQSAARFPPGKISAEEVVHQE